MKDKIKNKTAAQTFFNQYDEDNKDNNIEDTKNVINNNENNNNDDIYDNVEDKNKNNNEDDEYLKRLAQGKKVTASEIKKNKKVFTSFYMDPDLAVEVDKIASRGVKGDKSKLLNKAIRRLLEDYGVID